MELTADKTKLLAAFRILNKQLAESNTQLKQHVTISELRINQLSSLVLQTRNENHFLRNTVRKLKEQIKMITQVMVTVENHAETVCNKITRDEEQEENYQQLRQPVAPLVYERKRAERVAFVDEAAIQEDESVPEQLGNDASSFHNHSPNPVTRSSNSDEAVVPKDDESVEEHEEEEEEEDEEDDEEEGDDEDSEPNVTMELPPAYAHLAAKSPLVQRLKRTSRRGSFDESFETIDRDRVFKLGRQSQSLRDSYAGLSPNHKNSIKNDEEMDVGTSRRSLKRNDSDMDIDESIIDTVRKISVELNDASLSSNSVHSERAASLNRTPYEDTSNNSSTGQISNLKKTISETLFNSEDMLANASCSTPVTKGATMGGKTKEIQKPSVVSKTKSAIELHRNSFINGSMQPVVVLQPLTEENLKQHELSHPRVLNGRSRTVSKCRYKENDSENDESTYTRRQGIKLEHGSSTENLSVQSYESGRPRRKAAPVNMRERSMKSKLRRD